MKWKKRVDYSVTRPLENSKTKIFDKGYELPCMI